MIYWLCGLAFEKWAAARSVVSGSNAAGNWAGWLGPETAAGLFGTTVKAWLGEQLGP
jgi:hypothetical protein